MKHIERIDRIKVLVSQVHQCGALLLRRENINLVVKNTTKIKDHGLVKKNYLDPIHIHSPND